MSKKTNRRRNKKTPQPLPPRITQVETVQGQAQSAGQEQHARDDAKRTTKWKVLAWLIATGLAALGVWYAKQSIRIARLEQDESRMTRRADIEFNQIVPFRLEPGVPITVVVSLHNAGQVAATQVRMSAPVVFLSNIPPEKRSGIRVKPERGVTRIGSGHYAHTRATTDPFTTEEIQMIRDGRMTLYVMGAVTYEDGFGRCRTLHYCHFFLPEWGQPPACTENNFTEDHPCE